MTETRIVDPSEQRFYTSEPLRPVVVVSTQMGWLPSNVESMYVRRNIGTAFPLAEQFDERAQRIYGGLDPKTVFFPPAQREKYPDEPAEELAAAADALNDHGARNLELVRKVLKLSNVEWLGLAGKSGAVIITKDGPVNNDAVKNEDELGYIRRIKQTDIGVVGPQEDDSSVTLAMGVADCLAIPVFDTRTKAFGFAHAGRPSTGLRTSEKTVFMLRENFDSDPKDLVAYLGEGVCAPCYTVDERTYNGFKSDFGGETEIDKVLNQYPDALLFQSTPDGIRVEVDLYAFNKYLLATLGVGEIIIAANCTARSNEECESLIGETIPDESRQQFYSHMRAKGKQVGWTTQDGKTIELNTHHLTTPRNLAAVTRY